MHLAGILCLLFAGINIASAEPMQDKGSYGYSARPPMPRCPELPPPNKGHCPPCNASTAEHIYRAMKELKEKWVRGELDWEKDDMDMDGDMGGAKGKLKDHGWCKPCSGRAPDVRPPMMEDDMRPPEEGRDANFWCPACPGRLTIQGFLARETAIDGRGAIACLPCAGPPRERRGMGEGMGRDGMHMEPMFCKPCWGEEGEMGPIYEAISKAEQPCGFWGDKLDMGSWEAKMHEERGKGNMGGDYERGMGGNWGESGGMRENYGSDMGGNWGEWSGMGRDYGRDMGGNWGGMRGDHGRDMGGNWDEWGGMRGDYGRDMGGNWGGKRGDYGRDMGGNWGEWGSMRGDHGRDMGGNWGEWGSTGGDRGRGRSCPKPHNLPGIPWSAMMSPPKGPWCPPCPKPKHLPGEPRLRLVGGSNDTIGRLELYREQEWGTVCNDGFTWGLADVFCRGLGFRTAVRFINRTTDRIFNVPAGASNTPIWLDGIKCPEHARSPMQCVHNEPGVHDCTHQQDVVLQCTNDKAYWVPFCHMVNDSDMCMQRPRPCKGERGCMDDMGRGGMGSPMPRPPSGGGMPDNRPTPPTRPTRPGTVTDPTAAPSGPPTGDSIIVQCDFENRRLCDNFLSNGIMGANLTFQISTGKNKTLSSGTGPHHNVGDHTRSDGNGTYAFLECTGADPGEKAHFLTAPFRANGEQVCFSFSYMMYGPTVEELNAFIVRSPGMDSRETVWTERGNQGERWREASVTLRVTPGSFYRAGLEAKGCINYQGDIAIDDVRVRRGRCP